MVKKALKEALGGGVTCLILGIFFVLTRPTFSDELLEYFRDHLGVVVVHITIWQGMVFGFVGGYIFGFLFSLSLSFVSRLARHVWDKWE